MATCWSIDLEHPFDKALTKQLLLHFLCSSQTFYILSNMLITSAELLLQSVKKNFFFFYLINSNILSLWVWLCLIVHNLNQSLLFWDGRYLNFSSLHSVLKAVWVSDCIIISRLCKSDLNAAQVLSERLWMKGKSGPEMW